MKFVKLVFLVIGILFSNKYFAQSIRLTEDSKKKRVEVFLKPGVSPQGSRLFQFSFIKFKKFNDKVRSDSLFLITTSGKSIELTNPVKDTSYQSNKYAKGWYSSFKLSPEYIYIIKSEKITNLIIFVNNKRKIINISPSKSNEINNLVTTFF